MRGRILFIIFLVPLIEVYLLVRVGSLIGVLPTIGLVILTAVMGSALVRAQGLLTLQKIRQAMDQGKVPARELVEGAVLVIAGALLITPGFLTDTVGFLCMIPVVRRRIARHFVARWERQQDGPPSGGPHPGGGTTIEGDYRRDD